MHELKLPGRVDALKEIRYLIKSANICMFSTSILQWPMQNESLENQWVDPEGNIWILLQNEVHRKHFLANKGNIQLIYSNAARSQFLNVFGTAAVSFSSEAIENLLKKLSKDCFSSGPLTLIRVQPDEVYAWDESAGDMAPLLKRKEDLQEVEQKMCA